MLESTHKIMDQASRKTWPGVAKADQEKPQSTPEAKAIPLKKQSSHQGKPQFTRESPSQ